MTTALHRELRELGFRKRGSWLRATRPGDPLGVIHVVGVQLTQGSQKRDCRSYVNVGAGLVDLPGLPLDVERVRVQDCLLSERIGDHWDLDDDLDHIAIQIAEAATVWFAARSSADELLGPFEGREPSSVRGWLGQVEAVVAAWVVRGETERARALFDAKRGFVEAQGRESEVEHLDDLGRALGLLPPSPADF